MLKCNQCNELKDEIMFHIDKRAKSGRYSICKKCRKIGYTKSIGAKKIDLYIKQSIIRSIRQNKSGLVWEKVLGFTLQDLKNHLELLFDDTMTWNNYGTWGIALIIPKAYYHYNGINNEFKKCWSLKNMYPLPIKKCIKRKIDIALIKKYQLIDIVPLGYLLDISLD